MAKAKKATVERRILADRPEWRADADSDTGTVRGYAAVFDQETVIGGQFGFRERIAPGAFDRALAEADDVRALFNHDPNLLLGRTSSETLRLSVDDHGLRYEVDLPDTAAARDVQALISRGDVDGSSFGFTVDADEWDDSEVKKKGKLPLRTITSVTLWDVSPVTFPAYPQTSVSARTQAQALADTAEADRAARRAAASPTSVARAKAIAAREADRAALEAAKAWTL